MTLNFYVRYLSIMLPRFCKGKPITGKIYLMSQETFVFKFKIEILTSSIHKHTSVSNLNSDGKNIMANVNPTLSQLQELDVW